MKSIKKLMEMIDSGDSISDSDLLRLIEHLERAETAMRDINYPPYHLIWLDIFHHLQRCKDWRDARGLKPL